jgi:hypothetical protein
MTRSRYHELNSAIHFVPAELFPREVKKCWLRTKSEPFEIAGVAIT